MIPILRRTALVFTAAILVSACADPIGLGNDRGYVALHVSTPFSDDGAVQLTLVGSLPPGMHVVPGQPGLLVRSAWVADTLRIVVFGPIVSGPLVLLDMFDRRVISQIVARVDAAAARTGEPRAAVSGYALRLER